jgi:hypothetical protein
MKRISGLRLAAVIMATALIARSAVAQDQPIARAQPDSAPPASAAASVAKPTPRPTPATPSTSGDPTSQQIADWLKDDAAPVQPLDPRAQPLGDDATAPRQIHGEVDVMVSNRGYAGSARTSIPLGDASELDLGVGAGEFRTRYGQHAQPRSLSVGLFLDGRDVQRWLSRDKCNVPRWGVRLKDDPELLPDGSCVRTGTQASKAPVSLTP